MYFFVDCLILNTLDLMSRYIYSLKVPNLTTPIVNELVIGSGVEVGGVLFKDGGIQVGNGAAATPALCFMGSTNSGIFSPSSGLAAFSVGGVEKLRVSGSATSFDSSVTTVTFNSLQESTDATTGSLVVSGGVAVTKNMYVGGTFTSASGLPSSSALWTAGNGVVSNPSYSFTSDPNTGLYHISAGHLGMSVGGALGIDIGSSAISVSSGIPTTFNSTQESSSSTTGAVVCSGGIGVGGDLVITGGAATLTGVISSTRYGGVVYRGYASYGGSYELSNGQHYMSGYRGTIRFNSTTVALGLESTSAAGGVAIGSYAHAYAVDSISIGVSCSCSAAATSSIAIGGSGATCQSPNAIAIGSQAINPTGSEYAISIGRSSGMGTNATGQIVIGGLLGFSALPNTFCIGNNSIYAYCAMGSTSWLGSSDERLKTDIQDITWGIDLIRKIKPISFNWKTEEQAAKRHYGFGYHDIEDALISLRDSGLADANPDEFDGIGLDDPASAEPIGNVNPAGLIPLFVSAVLTLARQIDDL